MKFILTENAKPIGPVDYGTFYWCVKTKISKDGEIYLHADNVDVADNGTLIFSYNRYEDDLLVKRISLVISHGNWTAFYAASVIDGAAIAVEHWEGEVNRKV